MAFSNVAMFAVAALLSVAAPPANANPKSNANAAAGSSWTLDILKLGASADGKTDSTQAIMKAWKNACAASGTQKIVIPPGDFLTGALDFTGPCTSSIVLQIDGNLHATGDLNAFKRNWIDFMYVDNLSVNGHGTIDGQGYNVWHHNQCAKTLHCKVLPNSLVLDFVKNAEIRGVTLKNAKFFHLNIFQSHNVVIDKVTIEAPGDSPNTDGIHMGDSSNITIKSTTIATGDDCISIGPGTRGVHIKDVKCGPGHGISVGSLGRYGEETDVEDVEVKDVHLVGTTNGLRIKSYEDSKAALKAQNFLYDGITMDNVSYPIIIDQKYCPNYICSKNGNPKVTVYNIIFKNIKGTSNTPEAVTLDCPAKLPCKGIQLINVDLKYNKAGNKTMAVCNNAIGKTSNVNKDLACL